MQFPDGIRMSKDSRHWIQGQHGEHYVQNLEVSVRRSPDSLYTQWKLLFTQKLDRHGKLPVACITLPRLKSHYVLVQRTEGGLLRPDGTEDDY